LRPNSVDEEVVNVLLRPIDNPLEVVTRFLDEFSQTDGIFEDEMVVFASNGRVQVAE
jgi:hypothetical protein